MSRRLAAALAGAAVALALAFRFGRAALFATALALPATEATLGALAPIPVREEVTLPGDGGRLVADLYRPSAPRAGLVLVHGLSPAGRRHPELARLARLLARHGQLVLVPDFEGLRAFRLTGREEGEIRAALREVERRAGRAGVAGFSFGAGPALLAAADHPGLRVAGSFGGYADLRHVITYITTGVHGFGGRRYVLRQEEYNRWKLLALLVAFVQEERDRGLLEAIAGRKLANPADATDALEAALGGEGRDVLALVVNRREEAVAPLLARLSPRTRAALDRLSPLPAAARLSGRLLVAHGVGDDSIPFTEGLRLAEAAGGRARLALLQTFHHTGPRPLWDSLRHGAADGWRLFRLVDDLLSRP